MKKYILSICMLAAAFPVAAQMTQKVKVGNNQDPGVTYSLPLTTMSITVDAQCTQVKAGMLAQFAEKYLGITDAPQDDVVTWEITGIDVTPVAVPDTAKTFHIFTDAQAQVPSIHLTDEGLLWSINCEPAQVETAPAAEPAATETKKPLHAVSVMNEEILKAGSKNKQAEIAARQIFRIRESRQNLLTGEVDNYPADGASFQLVLDNLDAQEKAYLELFTGVRTTTTDKRTYTFVPKGTQKESILFRFSRHYGFVASDDLVGEACNIRIDVLENNTEVPVQTDAKGRVKPSATGIAYNVPGKIRYAISLRSQTLAEGNLLVAQLGHVERLSQTQFTVKKNYAKAIFDLLTGNIKFYE